MNPRSIFILSISFLCQSIFNVSGQYVLPDNHPITSECLSCIGSPCRKITGLFTRPELPLGYYKIATVPARSCNITIREVRSSGNYLALKSTSGYIINGDWSILPEGRYMGAGTGFVYSSNRGEMIQSPGPLQIPIDIMLIYQTRNPGIHYEYWYPVSSLIATNLVASQNHNYRRKGTNRKEGRRRGRNRHRHYHRNENVPLIQPPTEYKNPFHEQNTLGGNPNDIYTPNKLPDIGLPSDLNIGNSILSQNSNSLTSGNRPTWKIWKFTSCSKSCGGGSQEAVYICTGSHEEVFDDNMCDKPKPQSQIVACNPRPCPPGWQIGEWSPCSVTCGTGLATRSWTCAQEISATVTQALPNSMCSDSPPRVALTQPCTLAPCTRWDVSSWKMCNVECGTGIKSREVTCRAEGIKVSDKQCDVQEKPPTQELCHGHSCSHHTWFFTDWSKHCIGGCEKGIQTRKVWCSPGINSVEGECDHRSKPISERPCSTAESCAAAWFTGPWTECSSNCGNGTKTREVVCVVFLKGSFRATLDIECDQNSRPNNQTFCNPDPCPPHWYYTDWSTCSRTCGGGRKTRAVQCLDAHQRPSIKCSLKQRPPLSKPCNTNACPAPSDGSCVDRFIKCQYVNKARLCNYDYYNIVCCASCRGLVSAG